MRPEGQGKARAEVKGTRESTKGPGVLPVQAFQALAAESWRAYLSYGLHGLYLLAARSILLCALGFSVPFSTLSSALTPGPESAGRRSVGSV